MAANRSLPASTVIPELAYPDIAEAVSRLCAAFGFTLRIRMGDHRAQLNVGDGAVILTKAITPGTQRSRRDHAVMVRVENADAHFERARGAGIRVLSGPADFPYGERQYSAEDHAGHVWIFTQSIADVAPEDWGGTSGVL